jgi:hypothetical protein
MQSIATKYEVQQHTFCDGWINTWTQYDESDEGHPMTFDSYEEAKADLDEFIRDELMAFLAGHISSRTDISEFRIVKINEVAA